jgi:alkaline phosphatase D
MKLLGMVGLLLLAQAAAAARLVAGPMAGPPDLRSVGLWLQADGATRARIEAWPVDRPLKKQQVEARLQADTQFSAVLRLANLEPGTRYAYRVLLDGRPAGDTLQFSTQPLWQWRRDAPDFTLLAGSCAYGNEAAYDRPGPPYGGRQEIFDRMAREGPDLTLWLGDNIYYREVDYGSAEGMAHRWAYERRQPYLQRLLRSGAHAAIWDDHDYGPNDANASFVLKGEALKLQQRYWANPGYGLPDVPGAFTQFSFNDVDIFLLDNRWYRDGERLPDPAGRRMFGAAQMRWLKNALLASTARFKLVAGGSQMLFKSGHGDSWADFPAEQKDFLDFLEVTRVPGVLFISGDVHRAELQKLERPGRYPLHELTCSALTSGVYVNESLRDRPQLVSGTLVMGERNFCKLRFEGGRADRRLQLQVINADGEPKWQQVLSAGDLGAASAP